MRYLLWLYCFQTLNTIINPISIPSSPDLGGMIFLLMYLACISVVVVYRERFKSKQLSKLMLCN